VEIGGRADVGRPAVTIRRAGERDLATLRELWEECAQELAVWRRVPWTWTWQDVAPRLQNAGIFLAEAGGRPVGFVIGSRSRADIGHVEELYVRPSYRGSGVATRLLHALMSAFRERGVLHVALDVDTGNAAAEQLYSGLGFTPYAERLSADVGRLERSLEERLGP